MCAKPMCAKCPGTPQVCTVPLTVLAAARGGAQDGAVLAAVESVAVAVEGVMETGEVPGRNQIS